jgi:DNA-binding response OmpR family regulator
MSAGYHSVSLCISLFQCDDIRPGRRYTRLMSNTALPRILVVDDDPELRTLLAEYLGRNGLDVVATEDGQGMRQAISIRMPDAIVLDLMLPGEDGLSLARGLRTHSAVPILMLSARGEEIDRVVGLEVGADDYLAKPFSPRELLARLRALLRRSQTMAQSGLAAERSDLRSFGPFTLDLAAHRLLRQGQEVHLTSAEFDLLRVLVERPNRVLSRDELMDQLKGFERDPFDRSIDIRVTRLRRKIEDDSATPHFIRTVRGEGYLFNPLGPAV